MITRTTTILATALLTAGLAAAPALARTAASSNSEVDQTRQLNESQLSSAGAREEAAPMTATPADYVRNRLKNKKGTAAAAGANSRDDGLGASHTQSK
jgi:hypothetical protein